MAPPAPPDVFPEIVLVFTAAALIVYAVWCALRGRRGSPLAFKLAMLCAMGALVVVHP